MNSRDMFLKIWEQEFRTTMRVLRSFPVTAMEAKPHERSRSVRDLAWQCAIDEDVIRKILDDENDLTKPMPAAPVPETMEEIIAAYERNHRVAYEQVSRVTEESFNRTVSCFLPGGEWKMPQPEALWGNVMDQVHHRGQLTVYLRQAGAKVPSIYGPSGDEPMVAARN
jgi:uncharacterized damage-inducible protein DinB